MVLNERNNRIEAHLHLVDREFARMMRRLPFGIDQAELRSSGVTGLVDACDKFDPARARLFEAYASMRIRGAMLDMLRKSDPSPRRVRAQLRLLGTAVQEATSTLGRAPTNPELTGILGISAETLRSWQTEQPITFCSLDSDQTSGNPSGSMHDLLADGAEGVREGLEREEQIAILVQLVAELPDRTRKVLAMSYYEGMSLAEIAAGMGCTESRICQIRREAVQLLKRRLLSELCPTLHGSEPACAGDPRRVDTDS